MKPSSEVAERVAVIGNYGVGKTEAWVSWAYWLRKTETPGSVFVINCERDGSVQRANERFSDWRANIQFQDVNSWTELTSVTKLFTGVAQEGDLIVVDGADKPWEWVRDLYVETENRKAGRTLDESDPFAMLPEVEMDWAGAINPAFFRWFNSLIMGNQPAHLMLVGPSQPLKVQTERSAWGDAKETLDLFSSFGVRWAGQKRLGFDMQTLLLAEIKQGNRVVSTMKDAGGREYMDKEPVGTVEEGGFVFSYLVGRAGWALA